MRFGGSSNLLYADFNQDHSRLTIGRRDGYGFFSLNPFRVLFWQPDEGASIVEMLFNTSLVAHVGAGEAASSSMRTLRMVNTKRRKEIVRLNYRNVVLAVRLNRSRLVLLLDTDIYIYDITNMKLIHIISSTPENPKGVCALASCHVPGDPTGSGCHNLLAYPGSSSKGDVYVYDTVNLRLMEMIEAHNSPVSALQFNNRGDRLATASEKGTVFRVFETPSGKKLFELRRGFATYASVSSMCFSPDSTFLSISSDKATIHVFKLEAPAPADTSTWSGYLTSSLTSAASYLPTAVTEVWTQARSHAQVQLPTPVPNLTALVDSGDRDSKLPVLIVVTEEGYLYRYRVPEIPGECIEDGKHRLDFDAVAAGGPVASGAAGGAPPASYAAAAGTAAPANTKEETAWEEAAQSIAIEAPTSDGVSAMPASS